MLKQRHQYNEENYQPSRFDDKNIFREGKFPDFGCEHGRMCVYTRYAPAVVMGSQTVAS